MSGEIIEMTILHVAHFLIEVMMFYNIAPEVLQFVNLFHRVSSSFRLNFSFCYCASPLRLKLAPHACD